MMVPVQSTLLLSLPCDCILAILSRVAGTPLEQAVLLADVSACCRRLCHLAEQAAAILVHSHMRLAHLELAALETKGEADRIDLETPVSSSRSHLRALGSQMPMLPLQWTLLRNSITDELEGSEILGRLQACGMHASIIKGSLRVAWPLQASDRAALADYVCAMPLATAGGASHPHASLHVARLLGLTSHPGLVARWRHGSRRVAICPGCRKYRRFEHAAHSAWMPDAIDKSLCPLPPSLVQSNADYAALLKGRGSSRDAEEFEAADLDDLVEGLAIANAIKCTCEGGGDICRFIGVPPG